MVGGQVKLLPAEVKKLGSDSNSGQFRSRSTTLPHRNWTLTPFSGVGYINKFRSPNNCLNLETHRNSPS